VNLEEYTFRFNRRNGTKKKNLLLEKVESLCVLDGSMWIATDNDGAGWTRMLDLGTAPKP
jgi:hypothetical protein